MAGAIYVKDGTPVTGSFSRIQIVSNAAAGQDVAGAMFDDIQWGRGNLADDDNVESSGSGQSLDFLSNGFKIRANQASINSNGYFYVYMAFAESPFKYSNAR